MASIPFCPPKRSFDFGKTLGAFFAQPGLPFSKILTAELIESIFRKHGGMFGRVYTTSIVLWAFMSQVLRDGKEAACQSAVSRIASYLQWTGQGKINPDTRDYCRARAKLSSVALRELAGTIASQCQQQVDPKHLFRGRHAKLVDGATFMMADTAANQAAYPQNPAQQPGIGFPIARFVTVISLATACVIDAAMTKYKGKQTGETALLRQLLHCFSPGDIAVADRFYGNYWMIALLIRCGADVCFRKHQKRHTDFRVGRRLGKNDHLVTWRRPSRPPWMDQRLYESMPEAITLREIRYMVVAAGRKQQPFVIVTTLITDEGEQEFGVEDLAELFSFRWNAELDLRSIKTHLNLHHLRCKSPAMVHREFWTTIIAYNAIRITAARSAELAGVCPRQISFVTTCQYVLAAWDVIASGSLPPAALQAYCMAQLKQIAQCLVGNRPGRFEPRVRKKRASNYNLMMQPSHMLKSKLARGDNSFETK
ncbi:MAG: hypothetical protein KatS3mg111_0031 [Pirellulaceae bacterium]|nr:MAG: hypothetical protein KatS3mg111_0031 [Pirellulaceae bacterium]